MIIEALILIVIFLIAFVCRNVGFGRKNKPTSQDNSIWWRVDNPKSRGKLGENTVSCVIGGTVENEQYVIDNLILEHNGKTSQIDHVVINPRGVFVIETKNYSGEIYGLENQREWTQVLARGNVKNKLYNPLKQNATHVCRVKQIIGNLPMRSLVVFVQNNIEHVDARNVIPLRILRNVLAEGKVALTVDEMKKVYYTLLSNLAVISEDEHVQNVREQRREVELGTCPRCEGKLVLRKGKFGEFLGCSNYPKCKFTKEVTR